MRMFYVQHNPPIATNAPFIRVIHLRKSKGSFHLNDMDGGPNIRTQYKLPVYIPYGMTIDILMVDRAMTSYHQGAIRNLMNRGEIAAFVLVNRDVISSLIGEVYDVNLTQSLVTVDTSGGAAFVTLPSENIPEGWEIEIKKTTTDLNQIQLDAGTGDIENAGPIYVVTGEQESVKLTYNEGTWWVLTKSSGAGGVGPQGPQGPPGLSAYEVAVLEGFLGTEQEWLDSLVGPQGPAGADGVDGEDGLSAYEVAVLEGFLGTEQEWLDSLVGPQGPAGAGESLRDYLFANSFLVPNSGTLYLEADGVNTASVPIPINAPCALRGMALQVNEQDISRTFALEVLVNGVVTDTLPLPLSTIYASTNTLVTSLNAGDTIALRIVRTSGTGTSTFNNVRATLEMVGS